MRILIAGGSGFIGKKLTHLLLQKGFEVAWLSRTEHHEIEKVKIYLWDPFKSELDNTAFLHTDVFINLAGTGIGDARWTKARKEEILNSRTVPQNLLAKRLQEMNYKGVLHIAASAIGYYGARTQDSIFEEKDLPASDFMGSTCKKWEEASAKLNPFFERNVVLRLGVVLGKGLGALKKMEPPFKLGLGAALGSGKQYMPWVHHDDVVEVLFSIIQKSVFNGTYNFVAPQHIKNVEFSAALAKALKRPFILPPVPEFVLKMALGEMSQMVLEGSRVSCRKISENGYQFRYPELGEALRNIYG